MSQLEKPLNRMLYQHIGGEVYTVWGLCMAFSEKDCGGTEEMVILSSVKNGITLWFPLSKFWDKHPTTQTPRFQLVTPTVAKV